jgi:hypothetical protein
MLNLRPSYRIVAPLAALTLCVGCALDATEAPPTEGTEASDFGFWDANGTDINGPGINGRELNGVELNGRELNGRELNGRELNGRELNGVELDGSNLTAIATDGSKIAGLALIGAEFDTTMGAGTPVSIRIADVDKDASFHKKGTVYMYTVLYRFDASSGWQPLCGTSNGSPIRAVPLQGRWDYRQGVEGGGSKINDPDMFTFACEGFTLQKCVRLGYEPWRKQNGVSLEDHHQTCVRVHRADYCGDGRSFTKDGTLINLYDSIGVQLDTESWAFESEWSPDGAVCVKKQRISGKKFTPDCSFEKPAATCGQAIDGGQTLISVEH